LKVLFSCSEAKNTENNFDFLNIDSLSFQEGYHKRIEILSKYQSIINEYNNEKLKSIFGVSKESLVNLYKDINIFKDGTNIAIERYAGVAYKHLDYNSLDINARNFINKNVVIFSNLFGVLLAEDKIPFYKLKQNVKLDGLSVGNFYKQHFQTYLDDYFGDDLIVDLRANSYDNFYDVSDKYHVKIKFLKNGKIISHYSKAYRGKFLRAMSQKEKLKDIHHFFNMPIENMRYVDMSDAGKQTTITYEYYE